MSTTIETAEEIVVKNLPPGTEVKSAIEYEDRFLFIAYIPDPLEGRMDPFFSVEKGTGKFSDFDITSYENPLEIINALERSIRGS